MRLIACIVFSLILSGCASDRKAPLLSTSALLAANAGARVRIIGTARFSKVTGPSIAGEDFQLRVYPRTLWGVELEGRKIEVTGILQDSTRTTPPDPSVLPGEYWVDRASWQPAESKEVR